MTTLTAQARHVLLASVSLAALALPADAAEATTAPPSSFADMLAMMPADAVLDPAAFITYTDMTLVWDRVGAGTDAESRLDSLGDLNALGTVFPQLFDNGFGDASIEQSEAEVGFSFLQIERELAVVAPPRRVIIDVTSVSPDVIDAAIESNPVWSERVTRVDTEHGSYVDWGDGSGFDPTARSPFRPLGQAGQFVVLGDPATTVRTITASDAEAVLATTEGAADSATTTAVLGPIAEVLADDVVMQAIVQPGANPFMPPVTGSAEEIEAALEQARLVLPSIGVGIVQVADGDNTRTEVLLVHFDAASATANVELVETALAEGVDANTQVPLAETFPDATVTVDGVVVRVDVSGEGTFREAYRLLGDRALFPS